MSKSGDHNSRFGSGRSGFRRSHGQTGCRETAARCGVTMILPGERKRALRGRNHAEGYPGGLIETMNGAQRLPSALFERPHWIGRPRRLENRRPQGGILTKGSALSPFHAEPTQLTSSTSVNCPAVTIRGALVVLVNVNSVDR